MNKSFFSCRKCYYCLLFRSNSKYSFIIFICWKLFYVY